MLGIEAFLLLSVIGMGKCFAKLNLSTFYYAKPKLSWMSFTPELIDFADAEIIDFAETIDFAK